MIGNKNNFFRNLVVIASSDNLDSNSRYHSDYKLNVQMTNHNNICYLDSKLNLASSDI